MNDPLSSLEIDSSESAFSSIATRRAFITGAAAALACASVSFPALASIGAVRRINLLNRRNGERLETIYYSGGEYDPHALKKLNNFMRDWRSDDVTEIDTRLIDIMSAVQFMLGKDRPFELISGYRSRNSNEQLRRAGSGVAKNSYHVRGMAADIRMAGVSVTEISDAVKQLECGGCGIYTRSNFVHIDSGPVRSWGS